MKRLLVLLPLTAFLACCQETAKNPLLTWMDRLAQRQLDQREAAVARIRSVAEADRRKEQVRAKILELMGGLPDYSGPLNARTTGRIENDLFVIEKVIFDSLPGIYITANVYRPRQQGRYPGILLPLGHWEQGKPGPQMIAANLAAKGFVVLVYDPVGQGERLQAYDRRLGRSLAGGATDQHFMAGAQSQLIGQSFARYRIWDGKRALDYLVSRADVDSGRIGCTGCSGGGTLSTYISALDPRIKVAAPACYMNSFRVLFAGPVGDSEQSLPDFLASGLDQTDYVELFAPKPWLISSTLGDFFTPEGARLVYEEARRWYRLYGEEEKVRWIVGPGGHGTPLPVREGIYEWMIRWLKDGKGDPREQAVKLYPTHELQVTKTGQVADEPGSRDLYLFIRDEFQTGKKPGAQTELLDQVRRWVEPKPGQPVSMKVTAETLSTELIEQRIKFESEAGVPIEGTLLVPRSSSRKPAVLTVEAGQASPLAAQLARMGRVVLALNPRGLPSSGPPRQLLGDWLPNGRAWLIGRNMPGMRAGDILRGVDLLAAREDVDASRISAVAAEVRGIWLLMAAAIDPRIKKVWLDHTPYSLRAALESPIHTNLHDAILPGFALRWDLADLVKALGDRPVFWTDPADWMRRVVPLEGAYRYRHFDEPDAALIREFLR